VLILLGIDKDVNVTLEQLSSLIDINIVAHRAVIIITIIVIFAQQVAEMIVAILLTTS